MTIGHSHNKTVIPGKSELLNIEALDELGHNITNQTVFTVSIHRDNKSSQSVDTRAVFYVSDGCFDVGGPPYCPVCQDLCIMQHKRGVSVEGVLEDFCIANLKILHHSSLSVVASVSTIVMDFQLPPTVPSQQGLKKQ